MPARLRGSLSYSPEKGAQQAWLGSGWPSRLQCWVPLGGADWQGLECQTEHNGFDSFGAGSHEQGPEQGPEQKSRLLKGPSGEPARAQGAGPSRGLPPCFLALPQASRCVLPAARSTASSTVQTPRPHGSSRCWSPSSTWCHLSVCPATRGSHWVMDSPSSSVGSQRCNRVC